MNHKQNLPQSGQRISQRKLRHLIIEEFNTFITQNTNRQLKYL